MEQASSIKQSALLEQSPPETPVDTLYARYADCDLLGELEQEHREEVVADHIQAAGMGNMRLGDLLDHIRKRLPDVPPEEVERDVAEALAVVRARARISKI